MVKNGTVAIAGANRSGLEFEVHDKNKETPHWQGKGRTWWCMRFASVVSAVKRRFSLACSCCRRLVSAAPDDFRRGLLSISAGA